MIKNIIKLLLRFIGYLIFLTIITIIVTELLPGKLKYAASNHYDGSRFFNPGEPEAVTLSHLIKRFYRVLAWKTTELPEKWVNLYEETYFDKPPSYVDENHVRVSFVGHLTFLIQTNGVNILTDPIWSEKASPFSFIPLKKRFTKPGINFENLPLIDVVLISHNHYDHLDIPTLKMLQIHSNPLIIVPLGNAHVIYHHIPDAHVKELDWWQNYPIVTRNIADIKAQVHLVPAHHWSARTMLDRNEALWGSYIIDLPNKKKQICVIGDTAYKQKIFKDISEKFKNIHLSLIPIGAYKPQHIMRHVHMSPQEAAQAHLDLKSKFSIPSHYGTFDLSNESNKTQVEDLRRATMEFGIDKVFRELKIGTHVLYKVD